MKNKGNSMSEDELLEWIDNEIEDRKNLFRKPSHGVCCTCQICGLSHDDCVCVDLEYFIQLKQIVEAHCRAVELVNRQAEDEELWFVAERVTEAYLQKALRKLHEAIEGKTQIECAEEALEQQRKAEVTYDIWANATYVKISNEKIAKTKVVNDFCNFDLAEDDSIVGIEILHGEPQAKTLTKLAHDLDVELWKAMEIAKLLTQARPAVTREDVERWAKMFPAHTVNKVITNVPPMKRILSELGIKVTG